MYIVRRGHFGVKANMCAHVRPVNRNCKERKTSCILKQQAKEMWRRQIYKSCQSFTSAVGRHTSSNTKKSHTEWLASQRNPNDAHL